MHHAQCRAIATLERIQDAIALAEDSPDFLCVLGILGGVLAHDQRLSRDLTIVI